ncbi:hypothetical protein [Microbulbifer halophilus]
MDSDDFRSLSGGAIKVLLGLLRQYRGNNNGDLSATLNQAREWGVGSSATLAKALQELQDRALVVRTREGRFLKPGGCCALYALTWQSIDECRGKLEIAPTRAPMRSFSLERIKKPTS